MKRYRCAAAGRHRCRDDAWLGQRHLSSCI